MGSCLAVGSPSTRQMQAKALRLLWEDKFFSGNGKTVLSCLGRRWFGNGGGNATQQPWFSDHLPDLVISHYLPTAESEILRPLLLEEEFSYNLLFNRQDCQETGRTHSSDAAVPLALYGVGEL